MRETTVSNAEKKFILKCLNDYNRLDGRTFDEFRKLNIEFGTDWGSCMVTLGDTQVLAQVSCEVQVPKSTRPSEGILYINLDLNPLAAPNFEAGRQSDLSVQLNRLLEKCIKDSRTVDLESLCIKVKEKVWALRVDLNVLNHEGNILDCASVAALSALAHFRRPDVTCDGEEIIIHTYAQRDSIPTTIHHYPVCTSFAIFTNGDIILADPNLLEENVSDAHIMLGLNAYKELCGFYLGGSASMTPELILTTTEKAAKRATFVIHEIKRCIEEDSLKRQKNENVGFEFCNLFATQAQVSKAELADCLNQWVETKASKKIKKTEVQVARNAAVESLGTESAVLIPPEGTTNNPWLAVNEDEEESEDENMSIAEIIPEKDSTDKTDEVSDGSEEESVVVLNADTKTNKKRRKGKK